MVLNIKQIIINFNIFIRLKRLEHCIMLKLYIFNHTFPKVLYIYIQSTTQHCRNILQCIYNYTIIIIFEYALEFDM